MSNDDNNGNEGFYNPEAFAMAWGFLTITIEKVKELDPDFDISAIKLFDHLLGRTSGAADPEYEIIKKEARKIFEKMVRRVGREQNRLANIHEPTQG
jgi:hypothetical protein